MEKFENFAIEDKSYSLPVISYLHLTEKQPDEVSLNRLTQKEIQSEKGIIVKRVFGTIFLIVAITQIVGIFINIFSGNYDQFLDYRFIIHIIVFAVLCAIALALFHRNKAVSPRPAFRKYWMSYLNAEEDTIKITPSSSIAGLFFPFSEVISRLQLFYPVSIEIDEKEIVQFIAGISKVIEKKFADFPEDSGNEIIELKYGVTCPIRSDYFSISKINENLLSVNSSINIFRFYPKGKTQKGSCITLMIRTYVVKLGKYWALVNPVPQFMELNDEIKKKQIPTSEQKNEFKTASIQHGNSSKVVFVREDRIDLGTFLTYKGPSKADAMAFLSEQGITQPSYYVVVETPEGNYGKDIQGIYKE